MYHPLILNVFFNAHFVQETEEMYTPLHLVPPSVPGLITSIENKYKINASNIRFLYR